MKIAFLPAAQDELDEGLTPFASFKGA